MSEEVSLKVKIESNTQGLDEIKPKLDEVKEAVEEVTESSAKIGDSFLSLNTALVALDSLSNLFSKVSDSVSKLTSAYALQETAEVKLAQVMRNTMDATDADIQSIKELCSAQQELGIIGDEVQLAGAQELGTYLEKADTLKKLIPVMNDMVAQQYGLEASQESAVGIATMLGKVMEGQTSALSRYGYSFDEAQEQILKFGTEEERAATLAEVVSDSVGGVNEALAQTDSGKMKQTENTIGDLKETMGAALTTVQPFIAQLAEVGAMVTNIVGLGKAFVSIISPIKSAISGVKALGLALKSIGTIGIVGILTTITAAAVALYQALTDDAGASERLKEQTDAYNNAATESTAKINQEIAALKPLVESQDNDIKTVQRLNETYGDVFGTFATTAEWYDTLTTKVKDYALAQGLSAKNAAIARQLGEAQVRQMEVEAKMQDLRDKGQGKSKKDIFGNGIVGSLIDKSPIGAIDSEYGTLEKEAAKLKQTISDLTAESMKWTAEEDKARMNLKEAERQNSVTSMSYEEITKALSENEKAQKALRPEQESELARLKEQRAELLKLKAEREKALGIGNKEQGSTKVEVVASEGSLKYINDQISKLNAQLQLAVDPASRAAIQEEINRWEFDKKRIEIEVEGSKLTSRSSNTDVIGAISGGKTTSAVEDLKLAPVGSQLDEYEQTLENAQKRQKDFQDTMGGLSDSFSMLGDAIGGASGEMLKWAANSISAIAQVIPQIITLITAKEAEGIAGATASGSSMPFPLNIIAIAAGVAAVIASLAKMPKFAAGGIAYGPTLGLFGEYPGASNNPEVVAPLNKLRSILGDTGTGGGHVEFEIKGRRLVGVLARENSIRTRS